ncbi:MAG: heparinase II/III family protein [Candidatus Omnitrophica bacterium]|nr:heparinase II/III family protein [Candidatus Omnitrophota bacterium]
MRSPRLIPLTLLLVTLPALGSDLMEPWTEQQVAEAIGASAAFHPYPAWSERARWDAFRERTELREVLDAAVERARKLRDETFPALPATAYLDYQRTGRRTAFQSLQRRREDFLHAFALAECALGTGEFLDPLLDVIWAFCEESDWCMPAHTKGLLDPNEPPVDLRSTRVGFHLALIDRVLGEALPPELRRRLRHELDRRLFEPYLTRDFGWLRATHNWNSVCNGNILKAALLEVEDSTRIAKIIVHAQNALCLYLTGFDQDGGTAEGISYWNYGFSHYITAAHLLNLYSDGRLNLLAPARVREIAQFPVRIELSPGKYPSFSDGGEARGFSPGWVLHAADALDLPTLRAFVGARNEFAQPPNELDSFLEVALLAPPASASDRFVPEPFNYLRGIDWMISRANPDNPDGLVLAVQGGNNGENHNHNDVGTPIVHYRGESLVVDLGAPIYDRGFFSPQRYTYLVARSLGHSVPLVNGFEQFAGKTAASITQITHTKEVDTFHADITSAYPPGAGLARLIRTVALHRDQGEGWIELHDTAAFNVSSATFESALITYAEADTRPAGAVLLKGEDGGLRVEYNPEQFTAEVTEFDAAEAKLPTAKENPTIRRIAFRGKQPSEAFECRLKMIPLP